MNMSKPILVVMAAGMGSRYGGLKQIDPVGPWRRGHPGYSLYDARRAGFSTVVFIIKHEIEAEFKRTVGARAEQAGWRCATPSSSWNCCPEGFSVPEGRVMPWGTAHAVLSAAACIDAPFAVINADDYYGPACFRLIYDYLSTHTDGETLSWAMVGFRLENTVSENGSVSRGVCVTDAEDHLVSVTERTRIEPRTASSPTPRTRAKTWVELPGDSIVSMNLWGFTPSFVQAAKQALRTFCAPACR